MGSGMGGIKLDSANSVESGLLEAKGHTSNPSKEINCDRSFLGQNEGLSGVEVEVAIQPMIVHVRADSLLVPDYHRRGRSRTNL
jgi:hypothetical protein